MDERMLEILQQMSQKVGNLETALDLRFKDQEKTLTRLDETLRRMDDKLDENQGLTIQHQGKIQALEAAVRELTIHDDLTVQHESKIQALEKRVRNLESNQKWVVTLILTAVILGMLAKTLGI